MMPPTLESHVLAGRTRRRSSGDICVESVATVSFNGALMHGMHVVHAGGTREAQIAHALSEGVMEIDLFHRVYRLSHAMEESDICVSPSLLGSL